LGLPLGLGFSGDRCSGDTDGEGGLRGIAGLASGVGGLASGVGGLASGVGGLASGIGGLASGVGGLASSVAGGSLLEWLTGLAMGTGSTAGKACLEDMQPMLLTLVQELVAA